MSLEMDATSMSINNKPLVSRIANRPMRGLSFCCFTAVFLSSLVGAKIGPLSLNTIAPIPLLLYLVINTDRDGLSVPINSAYIWFCLAGTFSALVALMRPFQQYEGYISSQIEFIAQMLLICIPLFCLGKSEQDFVTSMKSAFVGTFRIHVIWAFAQYLCWHLFSLDINQRFLVDFLGGLGRESWTYFSNLGTATEANLVLRLSGMTNDPAFLGLIIVIGTILDKSLVYKVMGLSVAAVSMQRTTLVTLSVAGFACIIHFCSRKSEKKLRLGDLPASLVMGGFASIVVLIAVFCTSQVMQKSLLTLIQRFDFIGSSIDSGTMRHLLYLPVVLLQLLSLDPVIAIFGVGPKVSGLILNIKNNPLSAMLNFSMQSGTTWTIESDIAAVFGGAGFIGGALYLTVFYKLMRSNNQSTRLLSLALFVFGFMYGYSHLILGRLLITVLLLGEAQMNKDGFDAHGVPNSRCALF